MRQTQNLFISLLFLLQLGRIHCYNFLILHPFYSGSHVLTLHSITQQLISRGHSVTTVRFADATELKLKPTNPESSFNEIVLYLNNTDNSIPFTSQGPWGKFSMPMELLWSEGRSLAQLIRLAEGAWKVIDAYCNQLLSNRDLIEELQETKYDVAIIDVIYNECGLALASEVLDIEANVAYWAFSFSGGEAELTTTANNPSHVPNFMSELSHKMSFFQRVFNMYHKMFEMLLMKYHTWFCDRIIASHHPKAKSSTQLLADLNGALINTDFILDYPRLQPQTFLNIGGVQIKSKPNKLPENIKKWIDSADHGVILFSMGFIFNPRAVPISLVKALMTAFSRLPQKVILKFEGHFMTRIPKNVMVLPFIPQEDILAHPKTIMFFTHCGMHGVMEAIWHAVPMVGMPVFIDQFDVLHRMKEKEIAVGLDKSASSNEIYEAMIEVRDNNVYKQNILELSELMKKRKNHPMNDTIELLEYLADTSGAPHLRLASRHLNIIEYLCLDVAVFLAITTLLAIYLTNKLIKKYTDGFHPKRFESKRRNKVKMKKF